MAHRHWLACCHMGFIGTEIEEPIDLLKIGFSEEELNKLTDEEAEDYVAEIAYEMALDNINSYAKKD